jgi:hypothetical protein
MNTFWLHSHYLITNINGVDKVLKVKLVNLLHGNFWKVLSNFSWSYISNLMQLVVGDIIIIFVLKAHPSLMIGRQTFDLLFSLLGQEN